MPTTQKNFVALNSSALTGSGYAGNGVLLALPPSSAKAMAAGYAKLATIVDRVVVDLSLAGYAKNGGALLTLASSTPQTIDLTNLAALAVTAGDTTFATWKEIIFNNTSNYDVIVSPGSSNPLRTPLAGTSPTFTVYANSSLRWHCPAGQTVDSTHKTLKFDPGANNATIAVLVGGA